MSYEFAAKLQISKSVFSVGNDIGINSYHDKSGGEERHAEPEAIRKQWAQGVFTTQQ